MSEELNDKLCLKTVYDLLGKNFYIPAYQRGYRWTKDQVDDLLNDIWGFSQNNDINGSSFYCLQPVVVVQDDDHWQVVDGQQRLTTLYIILHYLEKDHLRRNLSDAYKKQLYSIEYETRPDSALFLKDVRQSSEASNIDFHHIAKAYEAVSDWFGALDYSECDDFIKTLLGKADRPKSVQVIWYDLSEECKGTDYAVDVFSRINVGKIPLTNAELVKALFLQQNNFHSNQVSVKQVQIASEWDAIEKSLQDSAFWYFICNSKASKKYPTRIEYIFDLMMGKENKDEKLYTFHKFNELFKASKGINGKVAIDLLWKEVKRYFLVFDQWFRDRELFHLIGFLVDSDCSILELKRQSEIKGSTKTEFKDYLKSEIREKVNLNLDTLSYGDKEIKRLLLLFNIQTLLATQEADVRFPFDRYKAEEWDIEHIRSQTTKAVTGKGRKDWFEDILEYFSGSRDPSVNTELINLSDYNQDIVNDICTLLLGSSIDDVLFSALYVKVSTGFQEQDEAQWADSIGNLALLDAATNRSYKNAMFPIKRKRIISNDMNGVFVPICTKNVFLKFYSKKMGDVMYWKESDAIDYLSSISDVLKEYLPAQGDSYE